MANASVRLTPPRSSVCDDGELYTRSEFSGEFWRTQPVRMSAGQSDAPPNPQSVDGDEVDAMLESAEVGSIFLRSLFFFISSMFSCRPHFSRICAWCVATTPQLLDPAIKDSLAKSKPLSAALDTVDSDVFVCSFEGSKVGELVAEVHDLLWHSSPSTAGNATACDVDDQIWPQFEFAAGPDAFQFSLGLLHLTSDDMLGDSDAWRFFGLRSHRR